MAHVGQSVFDYGQLHNYSAFNYESILGTYRNEPLDDVWDYRIWLGLLVSAVHGPQSSAKEIETNLAMLRKSAALIDESECNRDLSDYCYQIVYTKK